MLASASPRRRELLRHLGIAAEVVAADIDEGVLPGEEPVSYVRRLAMVKAAVVADGCGDEVLIVAADTTVDLDGVILGKPADDEGVRVILRALSGRTHRVHTGVSLAFGGRTVTEVTSTLVTFVAVSDATIEWYLGTGEPFDKAGAYALQGAGGVLVASVMGSVSNVVGLPLTSVVELARRLGVDLLNR